MIYIYYYSTVWCTHGQRRDLWLLATVARWDGIGRLERIFLNVSPPTFCFVDNMVGGWILVMHQ